ncbi:MAG: hypothetical protein J6X53_03785 [Abditibacteriota bacterium]|nr:hypothetical protein [Abditibacteriota bacterium]
MLIQMIERDMPIDCVLTADTGMEFPQMYEHLEKVDDFLHRERGIHITTIRQPESFEYLMFEQPLITAKGINRRLERGLPPCGNGWPGPLVRWCTGRLKVRPIKKEIKRLKKEKNAVQYIGIASDEAWRCKDAVYPLVEWGITEAQALQICYDHGFDFGGLYRIHHRVSCYHCPFQRLEELRNLRLHHPQLWKHLLELDERALAQFGNNALGRFRSDYTVAELDKRFAKGG